MKCSYVKVSNCWSLNHVYANYNFEGNGFKISGGDDVIPAPVPNKIFTNNIAAWTSVGLYLMDGGIYPPNFAVRNNSIYKSSIGIMMREDISDPGNADDSLKMDFHNNIIYGATSRDAGGRPYNLAVTRNYTESNNTWDYADSKEIGSLSWWKPAIDIMVSDADFVSLSPLGLTGPRKTDGSLPDVNFLKLVKGSALVGLGSSE